MTIELSCDRGLGGIHFIRKFVKQNYKPQKQTLFSEQEEVEEEEEEEAEEEEEEEEAEEEEEDDGPPRRRRGDGNRQRSPGRWPGACPGSLANRPLMTVYPARRWQRVAPGCQCIGGSSRLGYLSQAGQ